MSLVLSVPVSNEVTLQATVMRGMQTPQDSGGLTVAEKLVEAVAGTDFQGEGGAR